MHHNHSHRPAALPKQRWIATAGVLLARCTLQQGHPQPDGCSQGDQCCVNPFAAPDCFSCCRCMMHCAMTSTPGGARGVCGWSSLSSRARALWLAWRSWSSFSKLPSRLALRPEQLHMKKRSAMLLQFHIHALCCANCLLHAYTLLPFCCPMPALRLAQLHNNEASSNCAWQWRRLQVRWLLAGCVSLGVVIVCISLLLQSVGSMKECSCIQ